MTPTDRIATVVLSLILGSLVAVAVCAPEHLTAPSTLTDYAALIAAFGLGLGAACLLDHADGSTTSHRSRKD